MPVMKPRYQHVKIHRPTGTRYAEASRLVGNNSWRSMLHAIEAAYQNFHVEFNCRPDRKRTVVEVVGGTATWHATVIELPEEGSAATA